MAVNGGTTMVSREKFIAELAAQRRRRGITQTILAARIGVTQQSLSNWESGAAWPGRSNLAAWAATLDVAPPPGAVAPVRPECGTLRGYRIHGQQGEPRCDPCKDANTKYMTTYRAVRR